MFTSMMMPRTFEGSVIIENCGVGFSLCNIYNVHSRRQLSNKIYMHRLLYNTMLNLKFTPRRAIWSIASTTAAA